MHSSCALHALNLRSSCIDIMILAMTVQ